MNIMIAIEHIWLLELGKANADCDDIDDKSEYGHFTVPELLLCSGCDPEGNEWIAIKTRGHLHGFSFDYPITIIKKSSLDIDLITDYVSGKEELLEWAKPLDANAISRLIASALYGNLKLRQEEDLTDNIIYIKTSDPCIIYPSLYAIRRGYSSIVGLTLGEEGFLYNEKVYDGTSRIHESFNIHMFNLRCSNNCTKSEAEYFVFDGVDRDTETILSNSKPKAKTIRFSISSDPGGSISLAMLPISHILSQEALQIIKGEDREESADRLISLFSEMENVVSAEGVFTTSMPGEYGEIGSTIIDKEISIPSLIEISENIAGMSQLSTALFFLEAHLYAISKRLECKVAIDQDEDDIEVDEHVTSINLPSPFFPTLFFGGTTINSPFNIIDSDRFTSSTVQGEIQVIAGLEGATYDTYKVVAKIDDTFILLFQQQNYENDFVDRAEIPNGW
ncbi:MAG: hypothetical protein ACOYK4_06175 [Candidatus Planktophila sp.]